MDFFAEIGEKLSTLTGWALTTYIIAQVVGVVNTVLAVVAGQVKKKTAALILQVVMNSLMMMTEILLGAWSAVPVCVVAIAVSLIIYYYQNRERRIPKWVLGIAAAAFLLLTLPTYPGVTELIKGEISAAGFGEKLAETGWVGGLAELLPVIGAMVLLWGLGSRSTTVYRIALLINGVIWLLHDLYVMNYGLAMTHCFQIVSFAVGIVRLDVLAKKKAGGEKDDV